MPSRRPKGKHQLLLMALACGATVEAAASRAGLSQRTAYRLLATPWFRDQLQAVWAEMLQRATGMLTAGSLEASKTAIKLAQSAASEGVQLGAARLVLEHPGQPVVEARERLGEVGRQVPRRPLRQEGSLIRSDGRAARRSKRGEEALQVEQAAFERYGRHPRNPFERLAAPARGCATALRGLRHD